MKTLEILIEESLGKEINYFADINLEIKITRAEKEA
jgi:hypothetical protein